MVIAVLEGAGPPGAPWRHLTIDWTGDLAELGSVQDHILAQLVFHWAGRCANEPRRNPKSEADKKNLLHFDPILVYLYARIFFHYKHYNEQEQGTPHLLLFLAVESL